MKDATIVVLLGLLLAMVWVLLSQPERDVRVARELRATVTVYQTQAARPTPPPVPQR